MIAVLRIPNISIEHVQDCVPSLWPGLFSSLLDRLSQTGYIPISIQSTISANMTASKTGGLEGILDVIDALQLITGTLLYNLDASKILHQQQEHVHDLIDLLWELFKIGEVGMAGDGQVDQFGESGEAISKESHRPTSFSLENSKSSKNLSKAGTGGSLQYSEQEIQEWGLGPIRNATPRRKRSASPSKTKKKLRFSVRVRIYDCDSLLIVKGYEINAS